MANSNGSGELERVKAELLARHEELDLLYDVGQSLAAAVDVGAIGRMVVDRAVEVTRAEGGFLLRLRPESHEIVYRTGAAPEGLLEELAPGAGLVQRVLSAPGPIVNPEGQAAPLLLVPAQQAGQVFGVLVLVGKRDSDPFTAGDSRLLQTLGTQVAAAIHTERLVRELGKCERLRSELEMARELQRSLLPAASPPILGVEIFATCQPAGHVGGDYFDFFSLGHAQIGIVIADVSGHGVGSAMVMAGLRAMLHAEIRPGFSPGSVLETVNARLVGELERSGMFISLFLAAYNSTSGEFTYSNAGHPPPLLLGSGKDAAQRLDVGGPLLGLFPGVEYGQGVCRFQRGGVLVLYTDGLTEARGAGGEMFLEKRLVRKLWEGRALTAADLHTKILAGVTRHLGGAEPKDDITLIVTRKT